MDNDEDAKIARVENWLVENVRVITQANELTLSDFTYNCKSYNGQFSISVDGEAHNQTFHVTCALPSLDRKTTGTGNSRRVAEQQAARNALKELGVENQ